MGRNNKTPKKYPQRQLADGRIGTLHRIRAEAALGKPLPIGAVVHHPDEDKSNPDARLVICQDNTYHMLLHARMRTVAAGGNPNTDAVCARCRSPKPVEDFPSAPSRSTGRSAFCRSCCKDKMRARRLTHGDSINALRRLRYRDKQAAQASEAGA